MTPATVMQGLCNLTSRVSWKDIILKTMNHPLTTILITRPVGQHVAFAAHCSTLGLNVAHLPCLHIEPVINEHLSTGLINNTGSVLFTSKNAVINAHKQCPLPWSNTLVHAIGPATSAALSALNQPVQWLPKAPYNSESYLQEAEKLPPQKLVIIKGIGGRSLVSEQLTTLGWQVQSVEVYRRSIPVVEPQYIAEIMRHSTPDFISITSDEALQNLKVLTHDYWDRLRSLPLIVNSERCATLAKTMGFTQPVLVATSAGDEGQIAQIKLLLSRH